MSEFLGTSTLLMAVVGSSFMAARLTSDNALSLLVVAGVTAATLAVVIKSGAEISGSHFNPAVTIASFLQGKIQALETIYYMIAQITGAIFGVIIANAMFNQPLLASSTIVRTGVGEFIAEVVATSGLIYLALIENKKNAWKLIPLWIFAAYFFTSSTSFANPAVTVSRIFTEAPSGITASSVPTFILAQIIGMSLPILFLRLKVIR